MMTRVMQQLLRPYQHYHSHIPSFISIFFKHPYNTHIQFRTSIHQDKSPGIMSQDIYPGIMSHKCRICTARPG